MPESFDDPELKEAIQRAWSEGAPQELRRRVAESFAAPAQPRWIHSGPIQSFAAIAAMVLIATVLMFHDYRIPASDQLAIATSTQFVTTHDRCCSVNDHHFVPPEFASAMADTGKWLSSKAHVPVLAVELDDGWNYCGAGPCPVGGNVSGHLLFKRGKEDLSIFSIPAVDFHMDGPDQEYAGDLDGHGLAAFTRDGGLYFVVGRDRSGYADIDSVVRNVRQSLIKDFSADTFTATASEPVRRPPLAVLLAD